MVVFGESVSVRYGDVWLPGTVLWEYRDVGRARALVRYRMPGGVVVRRLHWRDELRPRGVVLEMDLMPWTAPGTPSGTAPETRANTGPDTGQDPPRPSRG